LPTTPRSSPSSTEPCSSTVVVSARESTDACPQGDCAHRSMGQRRHRPPTRVSSNQGLLAPRTSTPLGGDPESERSGSVPRQGIIWRDVRIRGGPARDPPLSRVSLHRERRDEVRLIRAGTCCRGFPPPSLVVIQTALWPRGRWLDV